MDVSARHWATKGALLASKLQVLARNHTVFIRLLLSVAAISTSGAGFGAARTAPDPADPFSFAVSVTLSKKAAVRLAALSETITISASYFGDPSPRP